MISLTGEGGCLVVISKRVHVRTLLLEETNQRMASCLASFWLVKSATAAEPIIVEFRTSRQTSLWSSVFHLLQLAVTIVSEIELALCRCAIVSAITTGLASIRWCNGDRQIEAIHGAYVIDIISKVRIVATVQGEFGQCYIFG